MKTGFVIYKEQCYPIAVIPNFFSDFGDNVTIGSESLNKVLYDDEKGYADEEAQEIDESIYVYMDDTCFQLDKHSFIKKAKLSLD